MSRFRPKDPPAVDVEAARTARHRGSRAPLPEPPHDLPAPHDPIGCNERCAKRRIAARRGMTLAEFEATPAGRLVDPDVAAWDRKHRMFWTVGGCRQRRAEWLVVRQAYDRKTEPPPPTTYEDLPTR